MTKVNRFTYDEIINGMIESLKTNIELKDDLNIMIKKYVDSEEYEEAPILKDFLNTIH